MKRDKRKKPTKTEIQSQYRIYYTSFTKTDKLNPVRCIQMLKTLIKTIYFKFQRLTKIKFQVIKRKVVSNCYLVLKKHYKKLYIFNISYKKWNKLLNKQKRKFIILKCQKIWQNPQINIKIKNDTHPLLSHRQEFPWLVKNTTECPHYLYKYSNSLSSALKIRISTIKIS